MPRRHGDVAGVMAQAFYAILDPSRGAGDCGVRGAVNDRPREMR